MEWGLLLGGHCPCGNNTRPRLRLGLSPVICVVFPSDGDPSDLMLVLCSWHAMDGICFYLFYHSLGSIGRSQCVQIASISKSLRKPSVIVLFHLIDQPIIGMHKEVKDSSIK